MSDLLAYNSPGHFLAMDHEKQTVMGLLKYGELLRAYNRERARRQLGQVGTQA